MIHAGLLHRLKRHQARGQALLGVQRAARGRGGVGPLVPRLVQARRIAGQAPPDQRDDKAMPSDWAAPAAPEPQAISMAEDMQRIPDSKGTDAPARVAMPPAAQSDAIASAAAPAKARVARAATITTPPTVAQLDPVPSPPQSAATPAPYRPPTVAEMRDALLALRKQAREGSPAAMPASQPDPAAEPRVLPERVPLGRRVMHVPGFNPGASSAPPIVGAPHTTEVERRVESIPAAEVGQPPAAPVAGQSIAPATGNQIQPTAVEPALINKTALPERAAPTPAADMSARAQPGARAPATESIRNNAAAEEMPALISPALPTEPLVPATPTVSEEAATGETAHAYRAPAIPPLAPLEQSNLAKDTRPITDHGTPALPIIDELLGAAAASDQLPATNVPLAVAIEPPQRVAIVVPDLPQGTDERGDSAAPALSSVSAPTTPAATPARPSTDERLAATTQAALNAGSGEQFAPANAPLPNRLPAEFESAAGASATSTPPERLPVVSGPGVQTKLPDIDPQDVELLDLPPMPTPLRETARALLHAAVGIDPAEVLFEQSAEADTILGALSADAVTDGQQVLLAGGRTDDTPTGLGVIAHELVHVARRRAPRFVPAVLRDAPSERVLSDDEALAREVERRVIGSAQQSAAQPGVEPIAPSAAPAPDRARWGELPAPWEPWPTQPPPTSPANDPAVPRRQMFPAVSRAQPQTSSAAPRMVPAPPPQVPQSSLLAATPSPVSRPLPARSMPLPTIAGDAPAIQRAELGHAVPAPSAAGSQPQAAALPAGRASEMDVEALARQVYTILKRRLAAEMRRSDNT